MSKLPETNLPSPINGVVREAAVDEVASPQDSVQEAVNFNFDRIGAIESRKGLTLLGAQVSAGNPILGMANYINNAGTTRRLLAKAGSSVYSYNGTAWSAVRTGITSANKARFANFIDLTYMVNGAEVTQTFNGSTFGSGNVGTLPVADFIEQYRSRIWVADSATDKLYYTNVVASNNTLSGGSSFLQISPQDGEKITGLKRHPRALLVFKNNHIYRVFSTNSTDPDPSISRGTYSQESIVEAKNGIYYHHPSGFYKFVFDGEQQEISRPIIDVIKAIPRSYYGNVAGWEDGDYIYWSIGDITLGGITFNNMVVRYTISSQVWTMRTYGSEIRTGGIYDDGTNLIRVAGDDNGNVFQFDTGNTDNGTPIFLSLATHWMYFTSIKSALKTITRLGVLHESGQGLKLEFQINGDRPNVWRPIGAITKDIYQAMDFSARDFVKIRFRYSGSNSGSQAILRNLIILDWLSEGTVKI